MSYAVTYGPSVPRREPPRYADRAAHAVGVGGWLTSNNLSHVRGRRILVTGTDSLERIAAEGGGG